MCINFVKMNRKLNNAGEIYITEDGFWQILNKSNKCSLLKKKKILKMFHNKGFLLDKSFDKNIIPSKRDEIEFLSKLEQALKPYNVQGVRQYTVLNYKIDYYISKLNLAIEYDENGHKNYTYEQQDGRQKEIEKELGCKFIRVSDNATDEYNIGLVIKEMIKIRGGIL